MLPGALSPDLGKQERTQPRQTTAGIPTPQQGHGAGACRWTADWRTADAAMINEETLYSTTFAKASYNAIPVRGLNKPVSKSIRAESLRY